ncbi:MAG: hypothetical protein IH850_12820 [Acidobacteria bacterium]|nr:hypothetical protein [Acidobacteriota bacterium]
MTNRLILLAAIALIAAACGGPDANRIATLEGSTSTTAATESQDALAGDEARLMDFSQCMRDNGVAGFPDAVVTEDGAVGFGGFEQFDEFDQDDMEAAFEACVDRLDGLSFAPGGANFDFIEIQDTLLEFSQCMRDNGFDLPDPDFSNFDLAGGVGPFGEIDPTLPDFEAALETCQDIFADFPFGG